MPNKPKLSIIIVNYNAPQLLAQCLDSVAKHLSNIDKEVIIVDNHSTQENLAALEKQFNFLKIVRLPKNAGFGKANNIGARCAQSDVLLLLNSDTAFIDDSLSRTLAKFRAANERTVWGLKLLWPDGRFQNSFSKELNFRDFIISYSYFSRFAAHLPGFRETLKSHKFGFLPFSAATEVGVVYGAAMLLFKKDFLELGGFDEKYFMYFEDTDFCDRLRQAGGKIIYYPHTAITHYVQSNKPFFFNKHMERSKYLYGLDKHGIGRMLVFCGIDVLFFLPVLAYEWMRKPARTLATLFNI